MTKSRNGTLSLVIHRRVVVLLEKNNGQQTWAGVVGMKVRVYSKEN
jgi:hypothetical protein